MAAAVATAPSASNGVHHAGDKIVDARLNFYLDPSKGGQDSFAIGTTGAYRRKFDERDIQIHDARGHETEFEIDTHGFQYCKRPGAKVDYSDDEHVKAVAYPEVQQLLKDVTGATSVYVFSHITRRDDSKNIEAALKSNPKDDSTPVQGIFPASYIHIDQTPACALQVLQDSFDNSSELGRHALENNGRWGIINVWRPISRIQRDPLAMCDARTIRDNDLLPIKILQPPKNSKTQYATTTKGDYMEIYYARYTEGQQWHYFSQMDKDEVLLIRCYDSSTKEGRATRCPHSAFQHLESPGTTSARESIEVRCLVFWEDEKN